MSYDFLLKSVIMGSSGAGKTSLADALAGREQTEGYIPTIGADFRSYLATFRGLHRVKIHIWDTGGDHSFRGIIESYCRGVSCVVLVYDVTSRASFQNIYVSYRDAMRANDCIGHGHPLFLIGNKKDLSHRRTVPKEEGERLARNLNAHFLETCATCQLNTNHLRDVMIECVFREIIDRDVCCKGVNHATTHVRQPPGTKDTYSLLGRKDKPHWCCTMQ